MDIKVVVATHKVYTMPADKMYIPVHAGAALTSPLPYQGDDTGDNISRKNKTYCELTCLYWAWKNIDADYIGLVHYRRHFKGKTCAGKWDSILSETKAEQLLENVDVILPAKRYYLIETIFSHYAHSHYAKDLEVTEQVLRERYPEYIPAYDKVMNSRGAHMFNMMIMKRDVLNEYCTWLFDILAEIERRLDISEYSDFDKRVFGRISELLLNVWMLHTGRDFAAVKVMHMEGENLSSKCRKLIRRKFRPEHRA